MDRVCPRSFSYAVFTAEVSSMEETKEQRQNGEGDSEKNTNAGNNSGLTHKDGKSRIIIITIQFN